MNLHDIFLKPYHSYQPWQIWLEAIATIFGILSVFYSIKKNILVYPTGLVSTVIYVFILFKFGLWGDCLINVYYTAMSIYGWILWSRSAEDKVHIQASKATKREYAIGAGLFLASVVLVTFIYYIKPAIEHGASQDLSLSHMDWANWLDVFTTSIFLAGMWFMAKRKIENWLFWIVGDLICIPMMLYKGLGITSLQYLVFTAMAVRGYLEWRKSERENALVL